MEPGSVVKLIVSPMSENHIKGSVERGALAEVVNGFSEFPDLYKELVERIGNLAGEFIWIKWIQSDPRWHGRVDGAYFRGRFNNLSEMTNRVLN